MSLVDTINSFATKSAVATWSPDAAPDYVRLAGYAAAGDGGGALYKRVGSEPTHGGKLSITLSDSTTVVWFEIAEEVLRLEMFGGAGDNSTINTLALFYAAALGRPIRLGIGTYLIDCPINITLEDGAQWCTLPIGNGFHLEGDDPVYSVLKLKDGVSTDITPIHYNIFAANDLRQSITLRNFTYDGNGANNRISPRRFKSAAVTITQGSPGIVTWTNHGLMAGDHVHFDTTAGLPGGLTVGNQYFVAAVLGPDTFTVTLSVGGAAINTVSAGSGVHTATGGQYAHFNTALVKISGSTNTPGSSDAYAYNVLVEGVTCRNIPGVNALVIGQSSKNLDGETTGGPLSRRIWVNRCRFHNMGTDSFDHSCIYGWADQLWVTDCVFEHPVVSNGIEGPVKAAELHGSANWFVRNKVRNFVGGVYATYNYTSATQGQWIADNDMEVLWRGVALYGDSTTVPNSDDIFIKGNRIEILGDAITGTRRITYPKRGLDLQVSHGQPAGLLVTNNILETTDPVWAIGVMLGGLAQSASVHNTIISDNVLRGFPLGIYVNPLGALGLVDGLKIADNIITGLVPAAQQEATIGIALAGSVGEAHVTDNLFSAVNGNPEYPLFLDPSLAIEHLHADGNTVNDDNATSGLVLSDFGAAIARRSGRDANPPATMLADPPLLADGSGLDVTITVPGAVPGDMVLASFSVDTQGILLLPRVAAADTVVVRFQNETGGSLNLGQGTLRAQLLK